MQDYLKTAGPEADEVEEASPSVRTAADRRHRQRFATPMPPANRGMARRPWGPTCVERVDACAETRLRVVMRDDTHIDETALADTALKR